MPKRIAFAAAATFLELNGSCLEVAAVEGNEFIYGSMDRGEFRFPKILEWVRRHVRAAS
jgi:prophage maintenance system killer protein